MTTLALQGAQVFLAAFGDLKPSVRAISHAWAHPAFHNGVLNEPQDLSLAGVRSDSFMYM